MGFSRENEKKLIKFIHKKSLLTEEEIKDCLQIQKKSYAQGKPKSFPNILLKKDLIPKPKLMAIMNRIEQVTAKQKEKEQQIRPSSTIHPKQNLKKTPLKPKKENHELPTRTQKTKKQLKIANKRKLELTNSLPKKSESGPLEKTTVIRQRTKQKLQTHLDDETKTKTTENKVSNTTQENLSLGKAALFLFAFCLLLIVLVVIGVLNKNRIKKEREKLNQEKLRNKSTFENSKEEEESLDLIQKESLEAIEKWIQEDKVLDAWEALEALLAHSQNPELLKKCTELLLRVELKIIQKNLFPQLEFNSQGRFQLHYNFTEHTYEKEFFRKNCKFKKGNYYQITKGSLNHTARCEQTLQLKILFNVNATEGTLILYGLNYRLYYPVSGKNIFLKIKGEKNPLWTGNGPPLTTGELIFSIHKNQMKLIYHNKTIAESQLKRVHGGGVVVEFTSANGKFQISQMLINSKFENTWLKKVLKKYKK